jgi:beta-lactamase class A
MQSVYKLPIAMAVLDRVEHRVFSLDQMVRFLPSDRISKGQHSPLRDAHPQANFDVPLRELLRLAVSESDGVASDILLRLLGGPSTVDLYVHHHLGIEGVRIADSEKVIGLNVAVQYRNYAQPVAMVALLNTLVHNSPLTTEHTGLLMQWMTQTDTGIHRIRGLLPPGTVVAHKTGTSGSDNGITNATNDVGIITLPDGRYLCIAVFVCDSPEKEDTREGVIAKIARVLWDRYSQT